MNIKLILNAIVTTKCLLQKLGETGIFMVGGELKILPGFFFFSVKPRVCISTTTVNNITN